MEIIYSSMVGFYHYNVQTRGHIFLPSIGHGVWNQERRLKQNIDRYNFAIHNGKN